MTEYYVAGVKVKINGQVFTWYLDREHRLSAGEDWATKQLYTKYESVQDASRRMAKLFEDATPFVKVVNINNKEN